MDTKSRKKYGLKQLNIEIPECIHIEIKKSAKDNGTSLKTWIIKSLLATLKHTKMEK
jgi:predicted HicB family RNase H-like nuclease